MKIEKKCVENIDLGYLDGQEALFPYVKNKGEHYRLLTYMGNLLNGSLIIDIGTAQGHSSLALSQNENNTIVTYDIVINPQLCNETRNKSNIQRKILDINSESAEVLERADLILLDIDPHDGLAERVFYDTLNSTNFKGVLLCDDIFVNAGMKKFWDGIERSKYDITEYGHWSGTGLVNFSDKEIE